MASLAWFHILVQLPLLDLRLFDPLLQRSVRLFSLPLLVERFDDQVVP